MPLSTLFLSLLLLLLPPSQTLSQFIISAPCRQAYTACTFRFRTNTPGVLGLNLRNPPDTPYSPPLRLANNSDLRLVNSNSVASEVIFATGQVAPISQFGTPPFTPSHLKPIALPGRTQSALAHQAYSGNQELFAGGACLRTFFTHYQMFQNGHLVNVALSADEARERHSCIVYRSLLREEIEDLV